MLVGGQGSEWRVKNSDLKIRTVTPVNIFRHIFSMIRSLTCHEAMGVRDQTVTAKVVCRHGHIVNLTALQAVQEAAGVVGVTGGRWALISHSLDRVRCGTFCCPPHHLGSAHVVVDGQIHGNTGLWREKNTGVLV